MRHFFYTLRFPLMVTLLLIMLSWGSILAFETGGPGMLANLLMYAVFVWAGWLQRKQGGYSVFRCGLAALPPFVLWHVFYTISLYLYSGRVDASNQATVFMVVFSFVPYLFGLAGAVLARHRNKF